MKHQVDANTEQVILEAAEKLFLEKGFAMTSTTEIAKAAGCNQALVHYYFRTKEKLFEAIFEKKMRTFVAPFLQNSDNNISFEERLTQLIEAHFDLLKENPKLPFLVFNELLTNPTRLESLKGKLAVIPQTVLSKIEKDLKAEVEKGTIRPISAFDLMLTILSLNVTLFLTAPIFRSINNMSDENFDNFIENRRRENVIIILRSLKP